MKGTRHARQRRLSGTKTVGAGRGFGPGLVGPAPEPRRELVARPHARCKPQGCTGPGGANAPGAATAFGLLPFLAAGQTHETRGPYRDNIYAASPG
jgi:hypothetical protein